MPTFGKKSQERLEQCHPKLQELFNEVVKHYDCTVVCGYRSEEEQNEAVRTGKSKEFWPHSKHNQKPAMAADVVPYPVDWQDYDRFYHFGGFVMGVAKTMGIKIRWGGDWDGDLDFKDQNFHDLPHFELLGDD